MANTVKEPHLVIIGYTNLDVNITPSKTTTSPGGAAYFVALAASKYLSPIGLVTRIGKDFDAKFLLSRVLPEGVHIISNKLTAKSTQIYRSDDDLTDRDIQLEWGVAPDINPDDIPTAWLQSARHFHVATMPPLQQKKFVDFLKKKAPQATLSIDTDIFLLSNPDNIESVKDNFSQADLVFVNRREHETLQSTVHTVPKAVVKLDKDGAKYLEQGKTIATVQAKPVTVVDVTGAGDIFAGVFLAKWLVGSIPHESLQAATDEATASVTKEGIHHLFK